MGKHLQHVNYKITNMSNLWKDFASKFFKIHISARTIDKGSSMKMFQIKYEMS